MKVNDFTEIAIAELSEHVGPVGEIIVSDSLAAAKLLGKSDITPLELRMLMLHFKMNVPSFLDASGMARRIENKLLLKK
jgi:hypothetical protein